MDMSHGHSHDENGMFGHHEAAYNAEKIIFNLQLIQDHYSEDPCADCLTKHWNYVAAYAEEGKTLDNAAKFQGLFNDAIALRNEHFKTIIGCAVDNVCKIKTPEDMMRMIQQVRQLRRKFNRETYDMEGDVTHDILVDHDNRHEEEVAPISEHEHE
jgi:hypothetical protein